MLVYLCFSVMNLLAEIYSQEQLIPKAQGSVTSCEKQEFDLNEIGHVDDQGEAINALGNPHILSSLAPRLWPFMRHSITSVRYSAIRTLVQPSLLYLYLAFKMFMWF